MANAICSKCVLSLLFAATLAGCGVQAPVSGPQSGSALSGKVHGGQQPIGGAVISLYASGAQGNGLGAVDLLAPHLVTTDGAGGFSITGDYTCPTSATQVYLVARGGNPGLGGNVSNSAAVMMTALGDCGNLSSTSFIFVNEVTTAASAWALAQFMAPGALVGASATNATGLRNAFLSAQNIVNTTNGSAPGPNLPQGAVTETDKLYTLANVLAPCINSDGGTPCAPLFGAATADGIAPTNTLDAALNIVRHPGANVATVFQAGPAQGPFQPTLVTQPSDWTMSVTYGGCALVCGGLDIPGALAIDSTGSVWVANYYDAVVSKFSPAGVPAASTGFPGVGLRESYGIAVDAQDNAWVSNQQSTTAANNSHAGSISKFNSAGTELSGNGYTGGLLYYPEGIAADTNGVLWAANYGNSSATLLANDGSAISANGYGVSALPFTSGVAVDGLHNAWFAVQQGAVRVTPAGVVSAFPCCTNPSGVAVDQTGNIWLADYGGASVVELTPTGAVASRNLLAAGDVAPLLIAVDGSGNLWTSNYRGNSISQIAGSTAAVLSPTLGYGLDAPLNEPFGIGIDASGNLWLANSGGSTLTQLLGLASPIATPLLGPPHQP